MEGKTINPAAIARAAETLAARYDYVLLEGAGGPAVPLNDEETTLDFVRNQGYPLIIVTSGRLGSISHTLLTLEACRHNGIAVEMLVYNRFPQTDALIENETAAYLQNYLQRHFPDAVFETMEEISAQP